LSTTKLLVLVLVLLLLVRLLLPQMTPQLNHATTTQIASSAVAS
jgi:hypothetical protein